MNFTITQEFLPEKEYLAIKGFCAFGDKAPAEYAEWMRMSGELNVNGFDCYVENDLNARVRKLLQQSGATEVYGLFCNSCRYDGQIKTYIVGADIACENKNKIQARDGFEIIRLDPSEYLVIEYSYGNDMTYEQAWKEIDDYFWGVWLKYNPYVSLIEGEYANDPRTADIGFKEPGRVKEWHAIRRKDMAL